MIELFALTLLFISGCVVGAAIFYVWLWISLMIGGRSPKENPCNPKGLN